MPVHSFETVLFRPEGVGTSTFLTIPRHVSESFGSKGLVRVKGTINGYPFRTTALPAGGGMHNIVVEKGIRDQIHAYHGDKVTVTLELDFEDRQVETPPDLAEALARQPKAKEFYERLSYSQKKLYVDWIMEAKQETTRQRRIEKALVKLSQGKKQRE